MSEAKKQWRDKRRREDPEGYAEWRRQKNRERIARRRAKGLPPQGTWESYRAKQRRASARQSKRKQEALWREKAGENWQEARDRRARQIRAWTRFNAHPIKRIILIRRRSTPKQYGMTWLQVRMIFKNQGRSCSVCRSPLHLIYPRKASTKAMLKRKAFKGYIEHDHQTGRVRGITCYQCNMKLAWFDRFKDRILAHTSDNIPTL